jgi:hypothetical protein
MNTDVTVAIPASIIRSDAPGFSRLGRLSEELSAYRGLKIKIDLGRVAWLDAHLAAPLLIVLRRAGTKGNTFEFINAQPDVELTLRKNQFLSRTAGWV